MMKRLDPRVVLGAILLLGGGLLLAQTMGYLKDASDVFWGSIFLLAGVAFLSLLFGGNWWAVFPGFTLVALELRTLDVETARAHYGEHEGKPFFGELVEFITSGPLVAGVIDGEEAIAAWRTMMGATKPVDATPGSIRADLATEMGRNIVHGSDSPASAEREIGLFFPGL